MILYQVAKWMEERMSLIRTIDESEGETDLLHVRKEQMEQQMQVQADKWTQLEQKSEPQRQPFVDPYMLDSLTDIQDISSYGQA